MIQVVGPGALGSMIAARLVRANVKAGLVSRSRKSKQVTICIDNEFEVEVPFDEPKPGSRFVVCTKAYDAVAAIESLPEEYSSITVLGNGILSLQSRRPFSRATTTHGCFSTSESRITHAGRGTVWLSDSDLFEDFEEAGLCPVLLSKSEMTQRLWHKLAANAALNPLTALHSCRNGRVLDVAEDEVKAVCSEIAAVRSRLEQRCVDENEIFGAVKDCVKENENNFSSMYQDLHVHRRRTEIDSLNGFILDTANRLGIAAPANQRLARAIRERENTLR